MRISHKHKFIFISIPKTASTVIRYVIHKKSDIISVDNVDSFLYHHVTAQKLKTYFEKQNWNWQEYHKFTIVRNPFARAVSQYFYWIKIASLTPSEHWKNGDFYDEEFYKNCKLVEKKAKNFKEFVIKFSHFLDEPQCNWTTLDMNSYLKQENLKNDYELVCQKINLKIEDLPDLNKTDHKHYVEYYDTESYKIVAEKYKKDIEYFNYEFNDGAGLFFKLDLEHKEKEINVSNQKKYKSGYSLVTCSMNRTKYLLESIQTWNELEELNEIVVVDYSSEKPILQSDLPKPKFGKKIILVRVHNEKNWVLSHAYNLGISFVQYDKLLKIDSDIKLSKDYIRSHPFDKNKFYSGNWKNARNENEIHFNGQLMCNTTDFFAVGGYNERITTYGYDDTDLHERLEKFLNTKTLKLNYDKMDHIESNSELRVKNQNINVKERFAISDLFKDQKIEQEIVDELIWVPFPDTGEDLRLFLETQINRIRCEKEPWSANDSMIKWKITKDNNIHNVIRESTKNKSSVIYWPDLILKYKEKIKSSHKFLFVNVDKDVYQPGLTDQTNQLRFYFKIAFVLNLKLIAPSTHLAPEHNSGKKIQNIFSNYYDKNSITIGGSSAELVENSNGIKEEEIFVIDPLSFEDITQLRQFGYFKNILVEFKYNHKWVEFAKKIINENKIQGCIHIRRGDRLRVAFPFLELSPNDWDLATRPQNICSLLKNTNAPKNIYVMTDMKSDDPVLLEYRKITEYNFKFLYDFNNLIDIKKDNNYNVFIIELCISEFSDYKKDKVEVGEYFKKLNDK